MIFPWKPKRAALVYPVRGLRGLVPRTAVLGPWVRPNGNVRVFPRGWDQEAAAFEPQAIAAEWAQIEALLGGPIPSLTHAILVLAHRPEERLTAAQRNRVWAAFGVPVFEQILDKSGLLLAGECEAHAGLHIESAKLRVPAAWLDTGVCGCGRGTPRLKSRPEAEEDPARAIAAYAR